MLSEWFRALNYTYIALAIMGLWLASGPLAVFWAQILDASFLAILILIVTLYALLVVACETVCRVLQINWANVQQWGQIGGIPAIVVKLIIGIVAFQLLGIDAGTTFVYEGF